MMLSIAPNEFTQPDFTVFYTAPDDRKLTLGRTFEHRLHRERNAVVLVC